MSGSIRLDVDDRVGTITIDHREKRNAIGPPLIERIIDTLGDLEAGGEVRTVVLTGAGTRAFSAGFDISYLGDDAEANDDEPGFDDLLRAVVSFPFPTIAMLNGSAYGGAVSLAAACDLRVAVDDATLAITPAKLGHIYTSEGIFEVMKLVGPANAAELLFTAAKVPAGRASEMGLLNEVVKRDELEPSTYAMAHRIAGNAPLSLMGMKRIIRAHLEHGRLTPAEQSWAAGIREEAMDSRDHREGVQAFREGRDPEFVGR